MVGWDTKKTEETRLIEELLRPEFPNTEAYRYNKASIRVRVIDPRFEGKTVSEREEIISPWIDRIPEETRSDILFLLTLAPSEVKSFNRHALMNREFEDYSRSRL